ncbi:hypothetical protein D1872_278640 [compost metagenome]
MPDEPQLIEGDAVLDRHDNLQAGRSRSFGHRGQAKRGEDLADIKSGFHNPRFFLQGRVKVDHPFAGQLLADIMQGGVKLDGRQIAEPQKDGKAVHDNVPDSFVFGGLDKGRERIGRVFLVEKFAVNASGVPNGCQQAVLTITEQIRRKLGQPLQVDQLRNPGFRP